MVVGGGEVIRWKIKVRYVYKNIADKKNPCKYATIAYIYCHVFINFYIFSDCLDCNTYKKPEYIDTCIKYIIESISKQ